MLQLQVYVGIVLSDMGLGAQNLSSHVGFHKLEVLMLPIMKPRVSEKMKVGTDLQVSVLQAPGWQSLCLFAPLALHPQCHLCLFNESVILGWCPVPLSDLPRHPWPSCLGATPSTARGALAQEAQHFPGVAQRREQNPWRPSQATCQREVLHVLLVRSDPWRVRVHFLANVTPSRDLSGT